jgi:hypothetical protein
MDYTLERGKDTLEISLSQILCYCRLILDTFPLQLTPAPQYNMSCKCDSIMNNVESTVVNIYFSEHNPNVSLDLSLPN